jgi:hypothetical protein
MVMLFVLALKNVLHLASWNHTALPPQLVGDFRAALPHPTNIPSKGALIVRMQIVPKTKKYPGKGEKKQKKTDLWEANWL